MEDWVQNKGEQLNVVTEQIIDIFDNTSEYVTLVQLMYKVINVIHAVIISVTWIFDSNYKKTFSLVI